ncbi:unnamed protein product [Lathyrus sativus]|nr:unnamed protein product [Lathyrus sativus]
MGQNLSCRGTNHDHGLFTVVQQGNLEIVTTMLQQDPSLFHQTTLYDRFLPLHIAAANSHIEILSRLLHGSVKPNILNRQKQVNCCSSLSIMVFGIWVFVFVCKNVIFA